MTLTSYLPFVLFATSCQLAIAIYLWIFVLKRKNHILLFGICVFILGCCSLSFAYNVAVQCREKVSGDIEQFHGAPKLFIVFVSHSIEKLGGDNATIIAWVSHLVYTLGLTGLIFACGGLILVVGYFMKRIKEAIGVEPIK